MIQVQKEMPRQRQGQSSRQSWLTDYRTNGTKDHPQNIENLFKLACQVIYHACTEDEMWMSEIYSLRLNFEVRRIREKGGLQ